ncbi:deoxyguanosinetriphosphate triphosphohydrolase [Clostridium sp. 'deep sea']|uniref:deoxyguanosinetriphosphate triphosphohydrolase n=1 Tax=Clostridium sp. 'deep sea' TaxID=2779445 RepID=UPI0018969280|nr:deoxyguanosinetriphosphate triphosphohydrolase [Clostridium sp. 'deep sea']QOR35603.1 deoxyguanosinetriphosphate triphosphohydrolase [Clostridium sp. 'deep sea']
MSIRQDYEKRELNNLSPQACAAIHSRGRRFPEEQCEIRTCFQRDRDRILHSKSFRRLKHKTQVFISPTGDHYRTRLTHTLEVSQIARTIGRALNLNEDLIEAIALGHDLGHTPFGHAGEEVLSSIMPCGFNHNEQSLRVIDVLSGGKGLNCTYEVRDGILNHTGPVKPFTLEGQIVKIADRIAYINHDIDDAIRGGVITSNMLPKEQIEILGDSHSKRINTMVTDIIYASKKSKEIIMSEKIFKAMDKLRDFMFDKVYIGSIAKTEEIKIREIIYKVYNYYISDTSKLPLEEQQRLSIEKDYVIVGDYISGMTDRYILKLYQLLFLPKPWPIFSL